jgi:hypothetical protein
VLQYRLFFTVQKLVFSQLHIRITYTTVPYDVRHHSSLSYMTLALLVVQSVQAKVRQWCLSVLPSNTTSQREIGIAILVERPERDPKAVIDSIWAPNCTGF